MFYKTKIFTISVRFKMFCCSNCILQITYILSFALYSLVFCNPTWLVSLIVNIFPYEEVNNNSHKTCTSLFVTMHINIMFIPTIIIHRTIIHDLSSRRSTPQLSLFVVNVLHKWTRLYLHLRLRRKIPTS